MASFKAPKFSNPFKSQSSSSDGSGAPERRASAPAVEKKGSAPAVEKKGSYRERASTFARSASASASRRASEASKAASEASAAASRRASEVGKSITAPPKPDPNAPTRVGFIGVSRDRKLVVWARDADVGLDAGPEAAVLSERFAALGRKMVARADPPGWDDLYETDARPRGEGGGKLRCIKLPVCDLAGTTSYVVAFGAGYPVPKAQSLCERLALLLGPMVECELGRDADGARNTSAHAATPEGCRRLRDVLEREIAHANSSDQLQKVSNQVEEVRAIMEANVEVMLDRGERLEAIEDKADQLSKATLMFRKQARSLKRWHLMNQVKWGVAVGTMVTASVAIPIAILAAA